MNYKPVQAAVSGCGILAPLTFAPDISLAERRRERVDAVNEATASLLPPAAY
jgi:hypothetical protein